MAAAETKEEGANEGDEGGDMGRAAKDGRDGDKRRGEESGRRGEEEKGNGWRKRSNKNKKGCKGQLYA